MRTAFSSAEEITQGSRRFSCTYLRACIDESLRLSPPAGSALWREVTKGGGHFDGQFVPEGFDVGTGIYAIHHNPDYFPEPFAFNPERWILADAESGSDSIGTATRDSLLSAQHAFNPFSLGPRSCIGKGLALTELTLGLATILYKYDFVLDESYKAHSSGQTEFQLCDHITASKDGPMVCFRERVRA